jgi:hypothetical protein
MKHAALLTSLFLVLAVQRAFAATAEEPQSRAALTIKLDKAQYQVGEPIEVTIVLTNTGNRAFEVDRSSDVTGMLDGYSFEVRDDTGQRILPGGLGDSMQAIGSTMTLHPGEGHEREVLLNYHVRVLEPGTYSVRCDYRARRSKEDEKISSPVLTLQVIKTSPAQMARRIESLEAELKNPKSASRAAALLRFTGQPQALKALLDMAYGGDESNANRAGHEMTYFQKDLLKQELMNALKTRGPRHFLMLAMHQVCPEVGPEVVPLLLPWLEDQDANARIGAIDGLSRFSKTSERALFPRLASRLKDTDARVRQHAAALVGQYRNADALEALKSVLSDPDQHVVDQATSAIAWVAQAAPKGSLLREDARATLLNISKGPNPNAQRARDWLKRLDEGK